MKPSDERSDATEPVPSPAGRPLRWLAVLLVAIAVMPAHVLVDLAPYVLRGGRPGPGLGSLSPLFFAMPFFHGLMLGVLLVLADRLPRVSPRSVRWALAMGLAALLSSPTGVTYFANAFEFGSHLALEGLRAQWPLAVGYACLGYCLAWALGRSGRPLGALALTGLLAGAGGCIVWMVFARLNLGLVSLTAAPLPTVSALLLNLVRWGLEGALIGSAMGLALPKDGRTQVDPASETHRPGCT